MSEENGSDIDALVSIMHSELEHHVSRDVQMKVLRKLRRKIARRMIENGEDIPETDTEDQEKMPPENFDIRQFYEPAKVSDELRHRRSSPDLTYRLKESNQKFEQKITTKKRKRGSPIRKKDKECEEEENISE